MYSRREMPISPLKHPRHLPRYIMLLEYQYLLP